MEEKPKKEPKPRAENYDTKLSVDLSFGQMIKVVVGKTAEVKKEKGIK